MRMEFLNGVKLVQESFTASTGETTVFYAESLLE